MTHSEVQERKPTVKKNSRQTREKARESKQSEQTQQQERAERRAEALLRKLEANAARVVETRQEAPAYYIGVDVGDRKSHFCMLNAAGKVVIEESVATTREALTAYFSQVKRSWMVLEVGTHSAWISELLEGLGHRVVVANARKVRAIYGNRRKNDRVDARTLARLLRVDEELLHGIRHRGAAARQSLTVLRARDAMVQVRSKLINSMRGLVKSHGRRLPACSVESFVGKVRDAIPESLKGALAPMLEQIESLTLSIRKYDRSVTVLAKKHKETGSLRQVKGVGELISVAYVLTVEDPGRFRKSREVGPYLGMVPRQDDSGDSSPQLRITKTGDRMLRRLMVTAAQYILGHHGEDCDLRRYGLRIAARGGKNGKKRAVVAVARKLAVLLHRLWVTGEEYEPLRNSRQEQSQGRQAAA